MTALLPRLQVRDLHTRLLQGDGPLPLVRGYLAHRRMREEAIRARVQQGARSVDEIVASIYADVDPKLHGAAALSTTAHLDHLVEQGKLRKVDGIYEAT